MGFRLCSGAPRRGFFSCEVSDTTIAIPANSRRIIKARKRHGGHRCRLQIHVSDCASVQSWENMAPKRYQRLNVGVWHIYSYVEVKCIPQCGIINSLLRCACSTEGSNKSISLMFMLAYINADITKCSLQCIQHGRLLRTHTPHPADFTLTSRCLLPLYLFIFIRVLK